LFCWLPRGARFQRKANLKSISGGEIRRLFFAPGKISLLISGIDCIVIGYSIGRLMEPIGPAKYLEAIHMERIFGKLRSCVAMILTICMVVGVFPVTAFAANENINYVSIDDSMANGYGLTGYHQDSKDRGLYDFMTGNGMYGQRAYPLQF
jgi:hypothetical protein